MSPTYRTTLTGPFPRPEALVRATRDLDRGRINASQTEAVFKDAEQEVARLESELQLDAVTGGYLRWADLFRPFTELWPGARAGALTRFFETNTFFRQPVLEQRPVGTRAGLRTWLPHGPRSRAILPGPFTFAALADLRYGPPSPAEAVVHLGAALAEELRALGAERPPFVQFQEPLLAYDPDREGVEGLAEAYRRIAEACAGSSVAVWTYQGNGSRAISRAAHLPVDILGFDLFETEWPSGSVPPVPGLGLGCIDPTTTLPEGVGEVASRIRTVASRLHAETVWLGPSPSHDLLPFEAAVAKARLLPELKARLLAPG